jgi:predicted nucleotidyltransferase
MANNRVRIDVPQKEIAEFCLQFHVRKLAFYGSVLREDFNENSDIDILVEFEPGHIPGFFALARMERKLSALFNGRKVDLRTAEDLSRYFRREVVTNAVVQYAQG